MTSLYIVIDKQKCKNYNYLHTLNFFNKKTEVKHKLKLLRLICLFSLCKFMTDNIKINCDFQNQGNLSKIKILIVNKIYHH